MTAPHDRPDLPVFPPLLPLSALLLGLAMQWFLPLGGLVRIDQTWRAALGGLMVIIGVLVMRSGRIALRRAGTAVNPLRPTTTLVRDGAFRFTRNPLYLGASIALIGLAFAFGLDWVIVLWAANLPLLHYGIVLREEAYLEDKFRDAYQVYRGAVPRYLWPFR